MSMWGQTGELDGSFWRAESESANGQPKGFIYHLKFRVAAATWYQFEILYIPLTVRAKHLQNSPRIERYIWLMKKCANNVVGLKISPDSRGGCHLEIKEVTVKLTMHQGRLWQTDWLEVGTTLFDPLPAIMLSQLHLAIQSHNMMINKKKKDKSQKKRRHINQRISPSED